MSLTGLIERPALPLDFGEHRLIERVIGKGASVPRPGMARGRRFIIKRDLED